MTLEDASLKLKKVEETPLKKEPSMMVEQLSWKNFIGVSNRSSWIHVDKRKPSRIDADKRWIGVDRRSGVEKRRRRILDKWFAAIIRFPPEEVTVVYGDGRVWLGVYRSPEEATLVYDREAYRVYGSRAILNYPHLILP